MPTQEISPGDQTTNSSAPLIGVLALQGAYDAHVKALHAIGARTRLVRTPDQLDGLDGLIMPGGESTTMLKFLERKGFFDLLDRRPVEAGANAASAARSAV